MEKVTVWLTSYNHAKYLRTCIESVLGQTYQHFQFYIVDDCSTDDSWNIIREYAEKDGRITTIRHERNWGGSGFDKYFNNLPGEYIAIIHSDDVWESNKLEKQVEILDNNRKVEACFTHVKLINDNNEEFNNNLHQLNILFEQKNRSRYEWLHYFFYFRNCLCHPSLLIRKNAYKTYNLFTRELHGYPDFCKWIRICMNAEIYIIQEKLTRFRIHDNEENTSGEKPENINRIHTEEYFVMKEYIKLLETHEVLDVFPEAQKYVVDGMIVEKYALAQIYLSGPSHAHWLIGLELLCELFQDEKLEEEIEKIYGYTRKNFNQDKQKLDIFNMIGTERFLNVSLYSDKGEGYSPEMYLNQKAFVQQTKKCRIQIHLDDSFCDNLQRVRLDLDEGCYRKFHIVSITNNGKPVKIRNVNGIEEEEWDVFYTLDPQYELDALKTGCLEIDLLTERIPPNVVENYFVGLQVEIGQLKYSLNELEERKIRNKLMKKLKRK